MRPSLSARGDERGSILVLSTVGVIVAIISAALAVDLGRLAQAKRFDQKVADLAALDASRDLNRACAIAKQSAARNSFDPAGIDCLDPAHNPTKDVVIGRMVNGTFNPDPTGDAVQVKVSSPFKAAFPFVSGPNGVSVKAAARQQDVSGFTIGSSLGTITPGEAALLGQVIGRMIGGSSVTGVGWGGLATGTVTLEALQTQLANMGFTVGSPSQLLAAELTVAQLYQATASALTLNGDTANANAFDVLKVAASFTTKIKLGQFINISEGAEGIALDTQLNLLQLVTQSAHVTAFNGSHAVSISNTGLSVPGVLSTAIDLSVIEPPRTWIGPEGTPVPPVSTGQIKLTVRPDLNLDVTVAPLTVVKVTNRLPVHIEVAGAKAYIKDISCVAAQSMTVNVDPSAFSGSISTTLRVSTLLGLPLLDVPTTSAVPNTDAPAQDVPFSYPSEFWPTAGSKHVGSSPVGLGSLTQFSAGTPVVLGILPVPAGTIVSAVLAALGPVIGDVDDLIVTPLLEALGANIGNADVTALADAFKCGNPALIA